MSDINLNFKTRGAKQAKSAVNSVGKELGGMIVKYGSLLVAGRKVTDFLKDSLALYAKQETAEKRLATALGYTSQALLDHSSALQQNSIYGDELIIEAQTLIASFVKQEDQIKKATEATLDLASGIGMDLIGAASLVSKTLGSTTNALSRYGITVEGAVGSTQRLTSLTDAVQKIFGGQAQSQVETYAGRIQQLSNTWGDLKETVGAFVAEDLGLTQGLKNINMLLTGQISLLQKVKEEFEGPYTAENLQKMATFPGPYSPEKLKEMANQVADVNKEYRTWKETQLEKIAANQQEAEWQAQLNAELAAPLQNIPAVIFEAERMKTAFEEVATTWDGKEIFPEEKLLSGAKKVSDEMTETWAPAINNAANMVSGSLQNAIVNQWVAGENALENFGKAFENLAAQMVAKAAVFGLLNLITSGGFAGGWGAIGSFLGFAQGGRPTPGVPSMVGERGPEMFVPDRSGTIAPTHKVSNTFNLNFSGPVTNTKFIRDQLLPEIKRSARLGYA